MKQQQRKKERFRDILVYETSDGAIKVTAKGRVTSQELFQAAEHIDILARRTYKDEKENE